MTISATMVMAIMTPETAAIVTSSLPSRSCHMRIGSMSVRASRRNSETGTLSNDDMKAMNAPAIMPGAIRGSVIRRSV